MDANERCVEICAEFEQFRAWPYPDPASPLAKATPRIRWGFKSPQEIFPTLPVSMRSLSGAPWTQRYGNTGPRIGPDNGPWTETVARANLEGRIEGHVELIRRRSAGVATPGQLAALASFYDNVGPGKFGRKDGLFELKKLRRPSMLWIKHMAGDHRAAAEQFQSWVSAQGQVMNGLVRRRQAERALYLS